jgi:putative transposase
MIASSFLPAILGRISFWTRQLVQWYNHQNKHSGLKLVTPAQRHDGQAP